MSAWLAPTKQAWEAKMAEKTYRQGLNDALALVYAARYKAALLYREIGWNAACDRIESDILRAIADDTRRNG